jgi:hypothetical protein
MDGRTATRWSLARSCSSSVVTVWYVVVGRREGIARDGTDGPSCTSPSRCLLHACMGPRPVAACAASHPSPSPSAWAPTRAVPVPVPDVTSNHLSLSSLAGQLRRGYSLLPSGTRTCVHACTTSCASNDDCCQKTINKKGHGRHAQDTHARCMLHRPPTTGTSPVVVCFVGRGSCRRYLISSGCVCTSVASCSPPGGRVR